MAYYRTCQICGANLDPGERCNCIEEQKTTDSSYRKKIQIGKGGQLQFALDKPEVRYAKRVAC